MGDSVPQTGLSSMNLAIIKVKMGNTLSHIILWNLLHVRYIQIWQKCIAIRCAFGSTLIFQTHLTLFTMNP